MCQLWKSLTYLSCDSHLVVYGTSAVVCTRRSTPFTWFPLGFLCTKWSTSTSPRYFSMAWLFKPSAPNVLDYFPDRVPANPIGMNKFFFERHKLHISNLELSSVLQQLWQDEVPFAHYHYPQPLLLEECRTIGPRVWTRADWSWRTGDCRFRLDKGVGRSEKRKWWKRKK